MCMCNTHYVIYFVTFYLLFFFCKSCPIILEIISEYLAQAYFLGFPRLFYLRTCTHTHTHTRTQAAVPSSLPSRSVGSTPLRKPQLPSSSTSSSSSPHHLPSSSPSLSPMHKGAKSHQDQQTFRVCLTPGGRGSGSSNDGLPNESRLGNSSNKM